MQILRNADNSLINPQVPPPAETNPAFAPVQPSTAKVTVNGTAYPQYGMTGIPAAPVAAPARNPGAMMAMPAPAGKVDLSLIPRAPSSSEIIAAAQRNYREPGNFATAFAQGWTNAAAVSSAADREREDAIAKTTYEQNQALKKQAEADRLKARQVEYIRARSPEMADAVDAGIMDAGTAFTEWKKAQKGGKKNFVTLPNGDYGFADEENGSIRLLGNAAKPEASFRTLTAEEKQANGLDPAKAYQIGPGNKISQLGGDGTTVNVNNQDQSEFSKKAAARNVERFGALADAGTQAASVAQSMPVLRELLSQAPQGPIQGRLAETFPGFNSAGDAFMAQVNQIAPTLRVPGSGAMSDRDMDILMSSLPRLRSDPAANQLVLSVFERKAQINAERGAIAAAALRDEITPAEADARIRELDKQPLLDERSRSLLSPKQQEKATSAPARPRATNPETGAVVEFDGQNWVPVK